jgi:hypothetical protein
MNPRRKFNSGLSQTRAKRFRRAIVSEHIPPIVSPVDDMVTRSRKFQPQLAGQASNLSPTSDGCVTGK